VSSSVPCVALPEKLKMHVRDNTVSPWECCLITAQIRWSQFLVRLITTQMLAVAVVLILVRDLASIVWL
jgi:hypothetical protein